MTESFVGEIRMFAGNFAPVGWALCDGQLLAVSQNDALFSLFGTIYGGDGRTTFGLPDLRGRVPIHAGQGPGLSNRRLGAKGGAERVTVTVNQLAPHSHTPQAVSSSGTSSDPAGAVFGDSSGGNFYTDSAPNLAMDNNVVLDKGGSGDHTNIMPFQCINFIVSLYGTYPSRT